MKADWLQLGQGAERIALGKERQRGRVFGIAVAIRLARIFFLEPCGIREYEPAQIRGAGRAEDTAAESLRHEPRQEPRVIEVRMCQHHRVNGCGVDWRIGPVPLAQRLQALEQTAVDDQPRPLNIQQVLGAGHGLCCAEKGESRHGGNYSRRKRARQPGGLETRC
jgi:hypothetical protein